MPLERRTPPFALNAISHLVLPSIFPRHQNAAFISPVSRERAGFYASACLAAGMLVSASTAIAAPGSGGAGLGLGQAGGSGGGYSGVMDGGTQGPSGGNGGDGYNYSAANAKGGQVGLSVSVDTHVGQSISGGNGGAGTVGNALQFHGSSGAGGGGGVFVSSPATVTIDQAVQVVGGNGGAGAGGRPGTTTSIAGGGGGGGDGVIFANGGTLVNQGGIVEGGKGGAGASKWGTMESATGGGGGGAAVSGVNVNIINSGTLSGGAGGSGGTANNAAAGKGEQGAAIKWTGGSNNRLQMDAGSVINGAIWVQTPARAEIVANTDGLSMANQFVFDGVATLNTQDHALTISGVVSGKGSMEKTGSGVLTLTNTNTYQGDTVVREGTISTSANGNLGAASSKLRLDGGTVQNTTSYTMTRDVLLGSAGGALLTDAGTTLTLDGVISDAVAGGAGRLTKAGDGTLILNGANTYSGATHVDAGTLLAGAANTLSANSVYSVQFGADLDLNGHDQTIAGMNNSGLVNLLGDVPGTLLTVTGVWHGSGGVLRLGVVLDDSTSISDRLVLDGAAANVTGTTHIQVVNLDGLGALTEGDGIEVVSAINGASSTAQSSADGFRLVGGHVDAGAYEYRLFAADANGAGESWYLRSSLAGSDAPAYRRETLLYGALPEQFRQANQAMLGTLSHRAGSAQLDGAEQHQAWGRVISAQRTINQSGPLDPTSEGRFNGFQVGSDLWANGDWRAGAYIGQLDGDMGVSGSYAGASDKQVGNNELKNHYLGGYGTWRNSDRAYADVVLQKGFHRYSAKSSGSAATKGKGESLSASIEAGQAFPVASGWHVEPQLQLMVQQLDMDDVRIPGARVQQDTPASWLGRAGLRVVSEPTATSRMLQPYTQVNLYKGSGSGDVGHYIGPAGSARIKTSGAHSGAELAVGANLHLSPTYVVYTELSQRSAFDDKTQIKGSTSGTVGMSLRW
jgi:outer membrane autotransporter protein